MVASAGRRRRSTQRAKTAAAAVVVALAAATAITVRRHTRRCRTGCESGTPVNDNPPIRLSGWQPNSGSPR